MNASAWDLFWKGFTVAHHEFLDTQTLWLQLEPDDRIPPVCSSCDHACFLIHDVHHRRVQETPLLICRAGDAGETPALPCLWTNTRADRLAAGSPHSLHCHRVEARHEHGH
ncbi:hypothetical protein [Chromohalobacter sp. 296-RDG]|uniref:hypothetical protein n=1 Tax=Chromohalobacter sp. 296-RDG TaxID=2994062 RepID=UPI00246980F8|nr:hypothetical protein [Chromohalobacter sp. 296-RDG]